MSTVDHCFVCDIRLAFPTSTIADQVKKVMEVDQESGNRVVKTFSLESASEAEHAKKNVLRIRFAATEARILRVSVSSFYDYLAVALKCYQEFDVSGSRTTVVDLLR